VSGPARAVPDVLDLEVLEGGEDVVRDAVGVDVGDELEGEISGAGRDLPVLIGESQEDLVGLFGR
jgi:hypothetical protein